ncbi:MAG: PLP-dependent cysteine synthase family protein, partial [Candidatus Polarisedimenticolia bacterium]
MRLQVADTALDLIGDTPLLHLRSFDAPGGAAVFAKLEFLNPGGSPQDRTALGLIQDAETRGRLRPGATLIDAGTGNAGIGLALVGARRGYRTIVVVPEDASAEKRALARALGATVVTTPASEGMEGSLARARAIAAETPGSFLPERFDNPANAEIHYRTTGREIWQQMQGRIDALVVGAASGGTFTGVARYLKERHPGALAVLVESEGSVLGGGSRAAHRVDEIGSPFFPA